LQGSINIIGARTHNLKNISLEIPRGKLTVVTGVSGSGKSSLVFDTLYAEGQRRYVQSLSTYARMFLARMERPDVDAISDIPPALALRQKNTIKNARSTVGTVTEINDYIRLLFATIGKTICPACGSEVTRDSVEAAARRVLATPGMYIFTAPFEMGSRSPFEAANWLIANGYHRLFEGGAVVETAEFAEHLKNGGASRTSPLDAVIDRVSVTGDSEAERVREALEKSFYLGAGRARAILAERREGVIAQVDAIELDRRFNCSRCGTPFPDPSPALFSSNSPIGACPECEGFGRTVELDLEKVIPNPNLSIRQGLIAPWRTPAYREMSEWMIKLARKRKIRTAISFREMTDEERHWLIEGEPRPAEPIADGEKRHRHHEFDNDRWPGVRGFFRWLEGRRYKTHVRILLAKYRRFVQCPTCAGSKLKPDALNVRIDGTSIADIGRLSVEELSAWIDSIRRQPAHADRCATVLRELKNRVGYLTEVDLGYLTLERQARTLSGGEAQRIHLASALGSLLVGTLYALDEPTVGLHSSDARRLLAVLRHLRDLDNTVVVVEHDSTIIDGADFVVELGPGGGSEGGALIHAAAPSRKAIASATGTAGRVLLMRAMSRERRFTRHDAAIRIKGAREHNLQDIDVAIPLGRMVCVTGVSGSGKSTLVEDVLYNNYLRRNGEAVEAGECARIDGFEQIGAMIHMGQELPTRSMRSNPATYLKIYDDIRKLFASTAEAKRLGVSSRDFSFNVAGGRCEKCAGTGSVTIEMHFMADLEVACDHCDGRRFQSHILAIRYQRLNIDQVLDLTVDDALKFFAHNKSILKRLEALSAVGLGYVRLGQTTSTLSGGEAQRLKIARFLLADLEPAPINQSGKSLPRMFLLDEPTTGLSSSDIRRLIKVLTRLVTDGNTLVVIEHNLEFIAHSDYVIDLGPRGGDEGGRIVAAGSPLKVAAAEKSATGRELRILFGLPVNAGGNAVRSAARSAAGM
jgi:excinuclease ABC subunit A